MPARIPVHRPRAVDAPIAGAEERLIRRRRRQDAARGSAHARGYTKAWARYSRRRLLEFPLCVRCQEAGRLTGADVTDHIVPHRGDPELFWEPANHQSLCKPCHDRKTLLEDVPRRRK